MTKIALTDITCDSHTTTGDDDDIDAIASVTSFFGPLVKKPVIFVIIQKHISRDEYTRSRTHHAFTIQITMMMKTYDDDAVGTLFAP